MTIHKAKARLRKSSSFPGLDRKSSSDPKPLVCSLERTSPGNSAENEFLVAPSASTEKTQNPCTPGSAISSDSLRRRAQAPLLRCLHARASRAASPRRRRCLASGVRYENKDSLLATAWPALHADFESALRESPVAPPPAFSPSRPRRSRRSRCRRRIGPVSPASPAARCRATHIPGNVTVTGSILPVLRILPNSCVRRAHARLA